MVSTSSRSARNTASKTSVVSDVSAIRRPGMKPLKKLSASSMAKMFSLTIMQAPWSLVNAGLNSNPSSLKNAADLPTSFTARFTKMLRFADIRPLSLPTSAAVPARAALVVVRVSARRPPPGRGFGDAAGAPHAPVA